MSSAPEQAPPGWYPDPAIPGSERRWDGAAWIGSPHKTPKNPSLFGPAIDRAYWSNGNRPVQIARWVGLAGLLPIAVGSIATLAQGGLTQKSLLVAIVVGSCIAVAAEAVGIVLAAIGMSRAQRGAGALAAAVQILVASIMLAIFAVVLGIVALLLLRH